MGGRATRRRGVRRVLVESQKQGIRRLSAIWTLTEHETHRLIPTGPRKHPKRLRRRRARIKHGQEKR